MWNERRREEKRNTKSEIKTALSTRIAVGVSHFVQLIRIRACVWCVSVCIAMNSIQSFLSRVISLRFHIRFDLIFLSLSRFDSGTIAFHFDIFERNEQ